MSLELNKEQSEKIYLKLNKFRRELKMMGYSSLGDPINPFVNNMIADAEKILDLLSKRIEK